MKRCGVCYTYCSYPAMHVPKGEPAARTVEMLTALLITIFSRICETMSPNESAIVSLPGAEELIAELSFSNACTSMGPTTGILLHTCANIDTKE